MTPSRPHRTVHFHEKHYLDTTTGTKTVTVRWNENVELGPALFVFGNHPDLRTLTGRVTFIETHPIAQLTSTAARQPTGTDMNVFAEQLRANYYPTMPETALVQVVGIVVDTNSARI
ncbi:ASCH domain-containing protein [Rhodococcus sp. NBC_00297]|uniref:ASCH domain-containing protein n=1 Tax=Rhodococcus sp. NBC_00297 TaxID=2976005 RepID=UPI002E28843D|nr:ASCH domain-containing protein [Rhodococcus sp. NBC_00297]